MSKPHTSRDYEAELGHVRDNLLAMAGRVEQMISDAVAALLAGDVAAAQRTIEADKRVNQLEIDTDDQCLSILARRQPVASDLRFITLAMKMVTDLERIGDLAVNIGERTVALAGYRPQPFAAVVGRMLEIDLGLLREVVAALIRADADAAEAVRSRDDEVDQLYWQLVLDLQARMSEERDFLERGMHTLACAKFLERIGDHVTNLAELVVFLVRGVDVRHPGKRAE